MPKYRVTASIVVDWTEVFEAESEQEARDMAYEECEEDIPYDGHIVFSVRKLDIE